MFGLYTSEIGVVNHCAEVDAVKEILIDSADENLIKLTERSLRLSRSGEGSMEM